MYSKTISIIAVLLLNLSSLNCIFSQDSTNIVKNKAFGSLEFGGSYMGYEVKGIHLGFSKIKKAAIFFDISVGFINNSAQSMNLNFIVAKPFLIYKQSYFSLGTGLSMLTYPGSMNHTSGTPAIPFQARLHFTSRYLGVGFKANLYLPLLIKTQNIYCISGYLSIPISFKR